MQSDHTFTICSSNIYQLPLFTDIYRVSQFCNKILTIRPTVVCIQEAWTSNIINNILSSLRKWYPYSVSAQTHAELKRSGLMVLSVVPILFENFFKFKYLGGFPDSITRKGVLLCKLYSNIRIAVTHNVASYSWLKTSAPIQNLQLIREITRSYHVDLLLGDLNVIDSTLIQKCIGGVQVIHGDTDRVMQKKLDYCIVLQNLQCVSARIIEMRGISDHQMTYARLIPLN